MDQKSHKNWQKNTVGNSSTSNFMKDLFQLIPAAGRIPLLFIVLPMLWNFVSCDNSSSKVETPAIQPYGLNSSFSEPYYPEPYYPSSTLDGNRPLVDPNTTACLPYCE